MRLKSTDLQLKDFDQNKGIVTFYFASFDNVDADGDIIRHGAYSKTIKENRKRIKHFKNHNPAQVPGVIIDLQEDSKGAFAVSQLAKTTLGRDTLIEYEAGIITEHSQGFEIIKGDYSEFDKAYIIKEVKLWEVSSLTAWGANENTPTVDVKSAYELDSLLKKIEKVLKNTNISDERAKQLLAFAENIKSLVAKDEPADDHSLDDCKPIIDELKSKLLNQKLN